MLATYTRLRVHKCHCSIILSLKLKIIVHYSFESKRKSVKRKSREKIGQKKTKKDGETRYHAQIITKFRTN